MPNKPRKDGPSEKAWYYLVDNETRGPVSAAQLRRLLQTGQLGPETLVWCQGMRDWAPARTFKAGAAPRPTPGLPSTPDQAAATAHALGHLPAAGRVLGQEPSVAPAPRSPRRLPWMIVGALGATAILLCGVGIGYLLREPTKHPAPDRPAAAPQAHDQGMPSAQHEPPVPPSAPDRQTAAATTRSTGTASTEIRPATGPPDMAPSTPPAGPSPPGSKSPSTFGAGAGFGAASAKTPGLTGTPPGPTADDGTTTLYQVINFQSRSSNGLQGLTMAQERKFQILTRLTIEPRRPDQSRHVRQTVEQVRLDAADPLSRATYEAELNKLVGQQYSFTLNERDEITEFTGFRSTTATSPIAGPLESGFLVATVIDEDGWRELMERSFLHPPATAADRPWTRPVSHRWGPLGSWRGITTYASRGTEGYGTRYDFTSEMSYVPPAPTADAFQFELAGADFQPVQSNGYFVFDAQRGQVISVHEVFHVQGTVTAGLMGSSVQLQVEEHQEFSIQLSDQNPWQ